MCVKLPLGDLNPDPYPPRPTSTYTCGMTIAPRVCGGNSHSDAQKSLLHFYSKSFKFPTKATHFHNNLDAQKIHERYHLTNKINFNERIKENNYILKKKNSPFNFSFVFFS